MTDSNRAVLTETIKNDLMPLAVSMGVTVEELAAMVDDSPKCSSEGFCLRCCCGSGQED